MLLLFITAFLSVPAFPQIVMQIVKRMDSHQKALRSLRADVTINKFSVQFGGTYTKEGAVKFIPANDYFVRLDSTKPVTESFLAVKNHYLV